LTQYKFKSDITFYCPKDGSGVVLFDLKSHTTSCLNNISITFTKLITLDSFSRHQACEILSCENVIADEIIRKLSFQGFIDQLGNDIKNVC
jgi:hypothetical protein